MISSLPGKVLTMLVSTCILKPESRKLDIKRLEPGILFISLQIGLLQNSDFAIIVDFGGDSKSLMTSFKKCNVMIT